MKNKLVARSFLSVIRKNIGLDILLLAAVIGVIVTSLIPPQILKVIVDSNLVPKKQAGLLQSAVLYLAVLVMIGLFDFLKEAVLTISGQKISTDIQLSMMKKLTRIDALYFSQNETGTVVSRFTNDVDAIESMFTSGVVGMVIDLLKTVGIIVSMWIFSPRLGLLTVLLIPALFAMTRLFQRRMLKAQMKSRVIIGRMNNHISESIKSIQMIKSFSKEAYMEKNYEKCLDDNYRTQEKINFFDSVYSPIIQVSRSAVIVAVVLLSQGRISLSGLSVGMVAAAVELVSNLFAPVENLGMELQNIQEAISGIRRVNEFYETKEEDKKDASRTAPEIIPDRSRVVLAFDDVSFEYDEDSKVLEDIRLTLEPNENVTFIGRTGVGKTTLFRLVMGLLKPVKGKITINGVDVTEIPHSEKRSIFGYVDQDFRMVPGSVADQISLGDPRISREQIESALELTGLSEYVSSLEDGLDTDIRHGVVFSQGQKQLLAIARAVAANPPVLLLDEMTASLDSITEGKIVEALQRVSMGHTVLAISHRLSSMITSDRIVILENGRVKSAGTPSELLETDEWYRQHMALEQLTWR